MRLPPYSGSCKSINEKHSLVTVKSAKTGKVKRIEATYPSSGNAVRGKRARVKSKYYCLKATLNGGKCEPLNAEKCLKCRRFKDLRD